MTPIIGFGGKALNYTSLQSPRKRDWVLTQPAFERFLKWLDQGKESSGNNYIEMRRRLVEYFDRKNCTSPDDLADETINRVARRLEEERDIESETPAKYCYTVARFVFLEDLRSTERKALPLDETEEPAGTQDRIAQDERSKKEKMLDCLDKCTGKLEPANREMILKYYYGQEREKIENRRKLAETLGITMNALSIRACRIRDKLEACVNECAA